MSAPSTARLGTLYLVTLASFVVVGMFLTALQRFVTDALGGGAAAVGVAIGSFAVSALLLRPFIGRAVDARGRRPLLLASLVLLTAVAVGFTLADRLAVVVALRGIQGVAQAGVYVTVAAMVVDLAPENRRGGAFSRFSLFLYAGLGLGPPLAELLIPRVGFTVMWLTAAALHLIALAAAWTLPETGERPQAASPRPRFQLLHPAAVGPGLVLLFPAIGYASVVGFATLYADAIGMGTTSGALYTAFAATVIIVRLGAGDLADRFGPVAIAWPGVVSCGVGLAVLSSTATVLPSFVGVVLFAAGFALIFPALLSLTVQHVASSQRGEVLGSFTAFADLGMGGGAYLIGFLVATFGFDTAFGTAAAGCLLSALALARLGRRVRAR